MRKILSLFSFILGVIVLAPNAIAAELINAKVVSITDGDTLTAQSGGSTLKIRLACIDAPESNQTFGDRSKLRLSQLAPINSDVQIYKTDTDRYGRTIGVIISDRGNVNLQMVREGYAVVYDQYLDGCPSSRNQLLSAEQEAQTNRRIFWSQSNPCMPWDFRSGSCSNAVTTQPAPEQQPRNTCDPNYTGACIPVYPPDINCGDITARRFRSVGNDPHKLDGNRDGIACES